MFLHYYKCKKKLYAKLTKHKVLIYNYIYTKSTDCCQSTLNSSIFAQILITLFLPSLAILAFGTYDLFFLGAESPCFGSVFFLLAFLWRYVSICALWSSTGTTCWSLKAAVGSVTSATAIALVLPTALRLTGS